MGKLGRCTCGVELRGRDDADLLPRVRQHAKEAHDLDLNDDQIRDMMEVEQ
jgi:predicted small metal-binding protein